MPKANVNGTQIYYEITGDEISNETIVFLNGGLSSKNLWEPLVPTFKKFGFKVLLNDLRGQLLSDKPEGPYTFDMHLEDLKDLLDSLNIKNVHLVGTSYGGIIAQLFAIKYPTRVRSLSLIDTLSETNENFKLLSLNGIDAIRFNYDRESYFLHLVPHMYSNQYIKKNINFIKQRAKMIAKLPEDFFTRQKDIFENINTTHHTHQLHKIKCPTLILHGEKEHLIPYELAKIMADHIKGSEFILFKDAKHAAAFEKPDILSTCLLGFLMKNR